MYVVFVRDKHIPVTQPVCCMPACICIDLHGCSSDRERENSLSLSLSLYACIAMHGAILNWKPTAAGIDSHISVSWPCICMDNGKVVGHCMHDDVYWDLINQANGICLKQHHYIRGVIIKGHCKASTVRIMWTGRWSHQLMVTVQWFANLQHRQLV